MNNKKIIKFVLIFMFGMIAFFINNDGVFAFDFPSSGIGSYKGNYCDYEITTNESDTVYNNKHLYLVYDGGKVKWLFGSNGVLKTCGSAWENSGLFKLRIDCNQKDLKNKLVENDKLVRCSELFFKTDGSGISDFFAPDLVIKTEYSSGIQGSYTGILVNGTSGSIIDDTYVSGSCTIPAKSCTGDDANPSSSVANILIEKKHSDVSNSDSLAATANGYSISFTEAAKNRLLNSSVGTDGNMDCSGLYTLCKGTSCEVNTSEYTCDYDTSVDPACSEAESKLSALKSALQEYKSAVGAAQSAIVSIDSYNMITSYDRWTSAKNTADSKYTKVTNAYSEYKALYDKKYKFCSKLENPSDIYNQIQSLMKTLTTYAASAVKDCSKISTSSLSEEQKAKLESVCGNLKDDSESIRKDYNAFLTENGSFNIDGYDSIITCEGLLGSNVLDDIRQVLNWIKIAIPILLIILGSLDFSKAVLSDDPKTLNKATSTFVKRAIAAVAVFFAPFIVMYVLKFVDGLAGGCDIKDIFRGVIMWRI